jgi:hypothetical protein
MNDSNRNDQPNLPVVVSRLLAHRPARRHSGRVVDRLRDPAVAGPVATAVALVLREVLLRVLTSAGRSARPPSASITPRDEVTNDGSIMSYSRTAVVKETLTVRGQRI